ncbi:lytic transglycosylase domain-containing protein [Desulfurivibrio dismutans]|uniref:lytic transglycosylase domain-containing protein n=1 Tax=Desulfurivibrio dismutans TaxID=1398908 RepID=UPI0023DCA2B8|nr:lytic transglycosylase domain-containing protein [Desulfurivibrio alkaliphilus]MDF1614500.1 transglycosylase SLT domain-containing protein [Desulfurivibrio alkaliphilus]
MSIVRFAHTLSSCRTIAGVMAVFGLLFFVTCPSVSRAEIFPVYEEIKPKVAFWKDIYGRYYSTQGLLHDRYDLDLVYTVLEVENTWDNAARRRTRNKINAAREEYRGILLHLAAGHKPRNAREERVLDLFGDRATPERLRQAAGHIRFQRGLKDRFQKGVIRSGAYLEQIKEILRQYGLPEDLAYLPHVESSFNYEAYSRLGAAGIWQFMRATGRQYMTIDYVLDERRDPIRSTHAAAQLLQENYQRLGNWPLAITAYNHGATGMIRARSRHGDYPAIILHYTGNRFGFASRNFYSEFLAAREVAKNAERYFGLLELEPERRSHEIVLGGYASLAELAVHLGLDLTTLHRYNQGLREPVLRGEKYVPKGYHLRVPATQSTVRLAAALPEAMLREHQRRSAFYTVRRGDTAWEIARRHGVSLSALMAANQLNSRATIYAGQNLRIPGVDEPAVVLAAASGAGGGKRPPGENVTTAAPAAPAEPAAPSASAGAETVMAAASAESLAGVDFILAETMAAPADEDHQPVEIRPDQEDVAGLGVLLASARENGWSLATAELAIKTSPVAGGEKVVADASADLLGSRLALSLSGDGSRLPAMTLAVAGAGEPDPGAVNPAVVWGNLSVEEVRQTTDGRRIGYIRVEVEETLGHYADWLGIPTQELRRLNGFPFGRPIRLDQRLMIPLDRGVGQAVFEEHRYEYHKSLEEDFYAAYRVEGVEPYLIQAGDNIWVLGRDEFELPLWLIRKYNPDLVLDRLRPGDKIRIPVVVAVDKR